MLLFASFASAATTRFMFEATISAVNTGYDLHNNLGAAVSDAVTGTFTIDLSTSVISDFYVDLSATKVITITGSASSKYTDFTVATWTGNLAPYDGTVEAFMVDMNFHRAEFRIRDSSGTTGRNWLTSTQYLTADITRILPTTRVAPWKFIPTMTQAQNPAECNGGTALVDADVAIHAKYDLIAPTQSEFDNCLGGLHGHTAWRNMKYYNPDQVVCHYQNGPLMYTINPVIPLHAGGAADIIANHSTWIAKGLSRSQNLIGSSAGGGYDQDLEMVGTDTNWLTFWKANAFDLNGKTRPDFGGALSADGIDCIFSDNSNFLTLPMYDDANSGGDPRPYTDNPSHLDTPSWITGSAVINNASVHTALIAWAQDATTVLLGLGAKLIPNWCFLNADNGTIGDLCWAETNLLTVPLFAGMAEGVIEQQGGHPLVGGAELDSIIAAMTGLTRTRVLFDNTVTGCANLSTTYPAFSGFTCRQALWHAMAAFLEGFNTEVGNGYFGWGDHNNITWRNEFDYHKLHLGHSITAAYKTHNAWIHEFTDGFVILNALSTTNTGIPAPTGSIDHLTAVYRCDGTNFETSTTCGSTALGATFDLSRNEGIIVLKPGKSITNSDNHLP